MARTWPPARPGAAVVSPAMDPSDLQVRRAGPGDVPALVPLINGAFRGDATGEGWTSEKDLVGGPRIDAPGLLALLAGGEDSAVLVAVSGPDLAGCVHLRRGEAGECWLGLLSVSIAAQGRGVGRALLAAGEDHARGVFGSRVMAMRVVTARPELLAWYERRGYRRTGRREPFGPWPGVAVLRGPLELERLEKVL